MIDIAYCEAQRQAVFRRRRLTVLAFACALVLAVVGLASTGPADGQIEGNQRTVEATR